MKLKSAQNKIEKTLGVKFDMSQRVPSINKDGVTMELHSNSGSADCLFIYTKRDEDKSDPMSDYDAGFYAHTINGALRQFAMLAKPAKA
jgi:hypothetical protein